MNLYKIGEFSELVGVSISTLRLWHKNGKLIPSKVSVSGTRYYSNQQYLDLKLGKSNEKRVNLIYIRQNNKYKINAEVKFFKEHYGLKKKYKNFYQGKNNLYYKLIIDCNKDGKIDTIAFRTLLTSIICQEYDSIILSAKTIVYYDTIEIIEILCEMYGLEIEILPDYNMDKYNLRKEMFQRLKRIIRKYRKFLYIYDREQLSMCIKILNSRDDEEAYNQIRKAFDKKFMPDEKFEDDDSPFRIREKHEIDLTCKDRKKEVKNKTKCYIDEKSKSEIQESISEIFKLNNLQE